MMDIQDILRTLPHRYPIILVDRVVQVEPGRPRPDYAPPREETRRDEIRERMFALRSECEEGHRRACVRLGIIIGEHRERRAEWRREHPDLFWWER